MPQLRVLFATSEVYPLVKTGGLADISYALPNALREFDIDVRLLLPGYRPLFAQLALTSVHENLPLFPTLQCARLLQGTLPDSDIPVYVLECPELYSREGGLYQDSAGNDFADNALRFGALSKVAAMFGRQSLSTFHPDIIHCNDWQTGLVPAFLAYGPNGQARTVMSVHNLAYQGLFGKEMVGLLGLPPESYNMYGLEYYGFMSFLKAGLFYADWLTTVSPTYAQEIQTPEFGYGFYEMIKYRQHKLTGILNGIDVDNWNPATDPHISTHYSVDNLTGKAHNTRALRNKLGLAQAKQTPLIGMVSRITHQKGLDLVVPIIPDILNEGAHIVLLGSGDKDLENRLREIAKQFPEQVSVNFGYDESLARQIEAGADIFLMPSRFEPCGLNQMYSMRYGTVPIVRNTGGLADTVVDTTPSTLDKGTATGFVFERENSSDLLHCVQRALLTYRDKNTWRQLRINGMKCDFSWHTSAQQYVSLYQHLVS
ncbi:MAG: starch synthase [Beggiatoa sp. IS2]|nr:MAG: starch synthase [Beggiatoa sp. IS2]